VTANIDAAVEKIDSRTVYMVGAGAIGILVGAYLRWNLSQYVKIAEKPPVTDAQIGGASSPYWEDYYDAEQGLWGKRRTGRKEGGVSG